MYGCCDWGDGDVCEVWMYDFVGKDQDGFSFVKLCDVDRLYQLMLRVV